MSHENEEPREDSIPPWLEVALSDLDGVDFEQPICGSDSADPVELADLYGAASQAAKKVVGGDGASPQVRIWNFLGSVCGLHFKPEEPNEPFGPMMTLADGRRTAIGSDFRDHVEILSAMASKATNVVLRARLSDLVWLLDRNRAVFGGEALKAYVKIVQQTEAGQLKYRDLSDHREFYHETRDYLIRALGLARMLGWSKPEAQSAKDQLVMVRKRAVTARAPVPVHWFSEVDLGMRVSNPLEIAAEIELVIHDLPGESDHHIVVDMWRLAAKAYQIGKDNEAKERCIISAAELMVVAAGRLQSAMMSSHLLSDAIATLHGVSAARGRRLELRNRLVEVQAGIGEEMGSFSREIDLSDLVKEIRQKFSKLTVFDSLFLFCVFNHSPDPEALRREATEAIHKHPLSSLFGSSHVDSEGKVIHRTKGSGFGEADDGVIAQQIAQSEGIRRNIVVGGQIEPARQEITSSNYLSDDVFHVLMSQSPFVPHDLARTFARGFARFFQGDFTSALYTLTPLLENSLRHFLKLHGHDVTTFDDAGRTQEDRTITSLFDGMRVELDAVFTRSITEDIERVFLSRPGPMIRHGVAHGLLDDGTPYGADAIYACWLIFRLCLLPLYPHRDRLGLI